MPRAKITDDNGDGHFGYGELLKPNTVDALITQHNEHATALDSLESGSAGGNLYTGTSFQWVDDWLIGQQLAVGNGWNGSAIGGTPYSLTFTGANTAITPVTGTGRLGVVTLDSGTTTTGYAAMSTAASLSNVSGQVTKVGFEAVVGFPTLSAVAQEYMCVVGLVGNAPGYGVFFEYDRGNVKGVNPSNLDRWQVCTMQEGSATRVLLANTVAALTYPNTNLYRLRAEMNYTDNRGYFYINDTLVHTATATLPTHSLAGTVDILKSAGTTARSIAIDYTRLYVTMSTNRIP